MTDNNYSAPQSEVLGGQETIESVLQNLTDTKLWVRLCSIMGFIMFGFTVLVAVAMMVGMSTLMAGSGMPSGMGAGFGIVMGIVYLAFSLLAFFPAYWLHKYANAIGQAQSSRNMSDVVEALRYQKSFWKFVGIITLIYMIFFALFFVFGILGGIIAAVAS
ncbi:MAG: hypothetical protein HWE27_13825 [Gammaproteobacteria bacterium]|nr:hypothetical protein [Gammaproteobacteria bacterium]